MAAVTEPPHPSLGQTGWVTVVQSMAMPPSYPDGKVLGLVGLQGRTGPQTGQWDRSISSQPEMEEPYWPIPDPTLSYPAPNLIQRCKERAEGGGVVSSHLGVLVSGWHSTMADGPLSPSLEQCPAP